MAVDKSSDPANRKARNAPPSNNLPGPSQQWARWVEGVIRGVAGAADSAEKNSRVVARAATQSADLSARVVRTSQETQSQLSDLRDNVNSTEVEVAESRVRLQEAEEKLDQAELDLQELNEVTLPALEGDLDGLNVELSSLEGRVDAAEQVAEDAQTAADNAQTAAGTAQDVADQAAADALAAANTANNAQAAADAKGKVIIQSGAPNAADRLPQNLWIDTTGGKNTPKRWVSGSTWAVVTDKAATDAAAAAVTAQNRADEAYNEALSAATAAGNAQTSADGKTTNWFQNDAPAGTAHKVGDTWFDTNDGNRIYRWNGSDWVTAQFGTNAISDTAINAAKLAANAVTEGKILNGAITNDKLSTAVKNSITTAQSTADNAQTIANSAQSAASAAQTAASNAQDDADQAISDAAAAAGIAGGKADVLIQNTAPPAAMRKATTLWIDTTGGSNTPKRWVSGTTWTAVTDKAATDAAAAAATAQSAANAAQSRADDAHTIASGAATAASAAASAASAAQTAANNAQTTANGKNKIVRSTADASNPGNYVAGDQWWKYSGSQITAMWIHSGSAWVSQTLTDSVITNLNAGSITAGTISAARLSATNIKSVLINAGAIETANIAAGAITAASGIIADAAIGTAKIIDGSITSAKIDDLAVTNAKIANGTIQNAKIANLDAAKINTGTLSADRIGALSITAGKLAADSVTANKIAAGAVTANKIAANTITSNEITTGDLVGLSITGGTITGNEIVGGTIDGTTITGVDITGSNTLSGGSLAVTDGDVTVSNGVLTMNAPAGGRALNITRGGNLLLRTSSSGVEFADSQYPDAYGFLSSSSVPSFGAVQLGYMIRNNEGGGFNGGSALSIHADRPWPYQTGSSRRYGVHAVDGYFEGPKVQGSANGGLTLTGNVRLDGWLWGPAGSSPGTGLFIDTSADRVIAGGYYDRNNRDVLARVNGTISRSANYSKAPGATHIVFNQQEGTMYNCSRTGTGILVNEPGVYSITMVVNVTDASGTIAIRPNVNGVDLGGWNYLLPHGTTGTYRLATTVSRAVAAGGVIRVSLTNTGTVTVSSSSYLQVTRVSI